MPNANATGLESRSSASSLAPHAPLAPRGARIRRAALLAGGLAALAILLASAQVPCGFARIFHTPCPGCGSTRAMLALAHGDLHGLVHYNPFAPFMTILVVVLAVQAFSSVLTTGTLQRVGDGAVGRLVSRGVLVVATLQLMVWLARFAGFLGGPVPV
jgi:hypothetical protein